MLTIEDVETFHRVFGHPIKDSKEYLSHFDIALPHVEHGKLHDLVELRIKLIKEEAEELIAAWKDNDPVEFADALFDLLYVTYGAIIALGVPRSIGDEVQRSNMSKGVECNELSVPRFAEFCNGTGKIGQGANNYEQCTSCNGQGIVAIKREDGKILKGPNFSPPDIAAIIERECK
jgi:phosphoribosyl-ATP pyrophosphohydrolase